jgi:hypothetical protein
MRIALFVVVAACGGATVHEAPPQELGTLHVVENRRIEAVSNTPKLADAPPVAKKLLAAVDDYQPGRTHDTFGALADAIQLVAPDRPSEILQVRQVGTGTTSTITDSEALRLGLDAAVGALGGTTAPTAPTDERLRAAVAELRDAAQLVDPGRGVAEQTAQVRVALRAAVRAVYAATGAGEPGTQPTATAER